MFSTSIVEAAALSCSHKVLGASHRANAQTKWLTPVVNGTIRQKKESYRAWLTCEILEAADRYQEAKLNMAQAVAETKALVW